VSLLELKNVTQRFGGVVAVNDVTMHVDEGEVFALVGPNGAGKSTVFNLLSRFYTPVEGSITFDGDDLLKLKPDHVPSLGIARTFQNIELFEQATVLQNLLVGRHRHRRTNVVSEIFFTPGVREEERRHREAVEEVIDFLDLQAHRNKMISGLPYGVRKVVELGRALATQPKLLLLDEPASGLSVEETQDMAFWIEDIQKQKGITVLMVEHDMGLVSAVSDRVLALADGKELATGTPVDVQSHPAVIEAYLGTSSIQKGGVVASEPSPAAGTAKEDKKSDTVVLRVDNLESYYGPIMAIRGVSLEVREGQIVTVLGANGAGKTTLLKTISGVMDPEKGTVKLDGDEVQGSDPDHVVKHGMVHVPEGREIFPLLSVEENIAMGAYTRTDTQDVAEDMEMVYSYFPILKERMKQAAGTLSGGQQQMLAIGRGLMARPRLMLLDEPSLGLSPLLTEEIFEIISRLNSEQNVTMMLVEQNAAVALGVADYGYVMELGRIVMADDAATLAASKDVQEFYLGITHQESQRGQRRWKRRKTWR